MSAFANCGFSVVCKKIGVVSFFLIVILAWHECGIICHQLWNADLVLCVHAGGKYCIPCDVTLIARVFRLDWRRETLESADHTYQRESAILLQFSLSRSICEFSVFLGSFLM